MVEDDHDVEQAEGGGGNDEHVNGGDTIPVVPQKGPPGGRGRPRSPGHVFGDGRLAYADPELKRFAMDPGRAPERIGLAHLADQIADLTSERRLAGAAGPGSPPPVQAEALMMPLNDRRRLDQDQGIQAGWPEAI